MGARKLSTAWLTGSKEAPEHKKQRNKELLFSLQQHPAVPLHVVHYCLVQPRLRKTFDVLQGKSYWGKRVCWRQGCWWGTLQGTETISLAYIGCALQDGIQLALTTEQKRWHKPRAGKRYEGLHRCIFHYAKKNSNSPSASSNTASRKWGEVEQQRNCCWDCGTLSSGRLITRQDLGQVPVSLGKCICLFRTLWMYFLGKPNPANMPNPVLGCWMDWFPRNAWGKKQSGEFPLQRVVRASDQSKFHACHPDTKGRVGQWKPKPGEYRTIFRARLHL